MTRKKLLSSPIQQPQNHQKFPKLYVKKLKNLEEAIYAFQFGFG